VRVRAAGLSGQHLRRRGGRPCAQSGKETAASNVVGALVRRVCLQLSCWDVVELRHVGPSARSAKQCAFPLCLCEDGETASDTPPASLHHPPISDRPVISERVFHLYGSACATPSALILRAASPLPGATTRGPRACSPFPPVLFFASISSRARRAPNPLPARPAAESATTASSYPT
jgi:hypothetical protein